MVQSGLASGVNWLMQAAGDSTWLVLAAKRTAEPVFVASGYLNVTNFEQPTVRHIILGTLDKQRGALLSMPSHDTPLKRKAALDVEMMSIDLTKDDVAFSSRQNFPAAV